MNLGLLARLAKGRNCKTEPICIYKVISRRMVSGFRSATPKHVYLAEILVFCPFVKDLSAFGKEICKKVKKKIDKGRLL